MDLAAFLCGPGATLAGARTLEGSSEPREDSFSATLTFASGSVATIVYTALGDPSLGKERIEVFGAAGAGVLDDFRSLDLHRHGRVERLEQKRDKGHAAELKAFVLACRTGVAAQDPSELLEVSRTTLAMRDALASVTRSMRVLVATQYYPPEIGATQNRLGTFVDGLVARRPRGRGDLRATQPSRWGLRYRLRPAAGLHRI